ncbi:MAG: aminopeptidase [Actinomycetota bacterium]
MEELERSAQAVILNHLAVKEGEQVLIITDEWRRRIAMALFLAAREAGAEVVMLEILERETHGAELPSAVASAMLEADVIVAPTSKSLSHTSARKAATLKGARCASMPIVTEDMMVRALGADPEMLKRLGEAYAKALTDASVARLTSPGGSDCVFDLSSRSGISDDGDLSAKGAFGNLPAGEAFIAPVEGMTEGILVFDGSLSPDQLLKSPYRVQVSGGRVVATSAGPAPQFEDLPHRYGPLAWEIAELGVGTNDRAIITGNILEDEKVASTVHVAFGNNASIGGTTAQVASHHDGVIKNVTLELDGQVVLREGELLLGN